MKIKQESGFIGIDITVAMIVIMVFMSTLAVLFANIKVISKDTEREAEAVYIATNIIETLKAKQYNEVAITNGETPITQSSNNENITIFRYLSKAGNQEVIDNVDIQSGYTVWIDIKNYVPTQYQENEQDLIKIITITVKYKVGNEEKSVTIKNSIVKNNIS